MVSDGAVVKLDWTPKFRLLKIFHICTRSPFWGGGLGHETSKSGASVGTSPGAGER